jgi:hypothetical protein
VLVLKRRGDLRWVLLLPLYFQVDRGASTLAAELLLP